MLQNKLSRMGIKVWLKQIPGQSPRLLDWDEVEQWPEKPQSGAIIKHFVKKLINYRETTSDSNDTSWIIDSGGQGIDYLVDKMCANCKFFTMVSPHGSKLSGSNSQGACRGAVDIVPAFDSYIIGQKHNACDLFQWNGKNWRAIARSSNVSN